MMVKKGSVGVRDQEKIMLVVERDAARQELDSTRADLKLACADVRALGAMRNAAEKHNEILTASNAALMAHVERLRAELLDVQKWATHSSAGKPSWAVMALQQIAAKIPGVLAATPEQDLAAIKAEAGRALTKRADEIEREGAAQGVSDEPSSLS